MARFSPYDNNGGTCVAIAGADYCVIAADTRMSTGYSILTRDYSKICKLALQKVLSSRHLVYQHQHNKQMRCPAMGQLLSNTLYYKRFFPYYAFNVLGGLDSEGSDKAHRDLVLRSSCLCWTINWNLLVLSYYLPRFVLKCLMLSLNEAVDLVKDVFASATESDIYTGDRVEIVIVNAEGIRREYVELRKD
ncbi:hypothetical protein AQUCO_06800013v1 [Aquilegia coerulea]|uniref:Proteasome subunit beta n=1 Tax=Aquilegia coerulea TaxID=218851 RepID=A0A2G5CBC6_AQUCA|nr:hypothetical protein AQUCO_06800013v1 [Aquilegia coerulea]